MPLLLSKFHLPQSKVFLLEQSECSRGRMRSLAWAQVKRGCMYEQC